MTTPSRRHEEAVERDRNYADGYSAWALALIYSVTPAQRDNIPEAIGKMDIAMRLNPKYPVTYPFHLGQAHYVLGVLNSDREEYVRSEKYLLEALGKNPNYRPARAYLAAVYYNQSVMDNNQILRDKAQAEMDQLLKVGRPRTLYEVKRRVAPYRSDEISENLLTAWRELEDGLIGEPLRR